MKLGGVVDEARRFAFLYISNALRLVIRRERRPLGYRTGFCTGYCRAASKSAYSLSRMAPMDSMAFLRRSLVSSTQLVSQAS